MATRSAQPVRSGLLFELMTGFKGTAVLRSAIDLEVFDAVAALQPAASADAVAKRLDADPRGIRLLLGALAGLGLLTADEGSFQLAPGVDELLLTTSSRYCGGISRVASSYREWHALGRLTETVRTGRPVPGTDAAAPDFDYWADFATYTTFATEKGAALLERALSQWLAGRRQVRILDVGAGSGAYGLRLAESDVTASVTLQDWPSVLDIGMRNANQRGLSARVTPLPGDVFSINLHGPYDVIVVGNLLFLFSPQRAQELVTRLAASLQPGGVLAIVSFTTGPDPLADQHAHLLNLLMLSWTPQAEILSAQAYLDMTAGPGLVDGRVFTAPGSPLKVILARKP